MATAMLIDIENLIGGYSKSRINEKDFPFAEFMDAIQKNSSIDRFDVKRCYADWAIGNTACLDRTCLTLV